MNFFDYYILHRLFYSPYLRAVSERAEIIVARELEFSRDFKIEILLNFLFFLDRRQRLQFFAFRLPGP